LEAWVRDERRKLSRHSDVAGAIDYMLKRWAASPASSRTESLPPQQRGETSATSLALGRKAWVFAGSDRGGQPAGFLYSLGRHRQALVRIADHPANRVDGLMTWNWTAQKPEARAA